MLRRLSLLFVLILAVGVAQAQRVTCTASFDAATSVLSLDAVSFSGGRYQAQLQLSNSSPLTFKLGSATPASNGTTASSCYEAATFDLSALNIPDVKVGSDYYNVNLKFGGTELTLSSASKNSRLIPDSGIRINKASNPFATVDSNGVAYLGYQDRSAGDTTKFQSATDGLTFGNATTLTYNNRSVDSRKTLMPDGKTWRLYQYDLNAKVLTSYSSTDGNIFTADTGTRYTPVSADNNSFGVYDAYVATDNSVILTYVGDLTGKNNLRMARSTDNGLTFSFLKGNVLGDDDAGGGGNTFIDNKTMLLADGRRRMVTMRANEIHSFISTDGITYTREPGAKLKPADFASVGVTLYSLNDPVMVTTKEGKYRVYVAASTAASTSETAGNSNWAIVSAVWSD